MYLCTKTSIDNNGARAGGFDSYERKGCEIFCLAQFFGSIWMFWTWN